MKQIVRLADAYIGLIQQKISAIHGEIRSAENCVVSGYAYSLKKNEPLTVKLFINDRFVSSQRAEKSAAYVSRLSGSRDCGFEFDLANELEAGDKIEVKVGLLNLDLDNSPKRIPFLGTHGNVLNHFSEKYYNPPKVFFLHIPKTAGTTFREILQKHFRGCNVQPSRFVKLKKRGYPHFLYPVELAEREIEDCRYLSGHYPFIYRHLLGANCQVLTFLRDPVERAISNLNHFKLNNNLFKELSFEEIYEYVKASMNNMQVRFLAGRSYDNDISLIQSECISERTLDDAIKNLHVCFLVGISEEFDRSVQLLEKKWQTKLTGKSIPKKNVARKKIILQDGFLQRIKSDNFYDIQLYNIARKMFRAECAKFGL